MPEATPAMRGRDPTILGRRSILGVPGGIGTRDGRGAPSVPPWVGQGEVDWSDGRDLARTLRGFRAKVVKSHSLGAPLMAAPGVGAIKSTSVGAEGKHQRSACACRT